VLALVLMATEQATDELQLFAIKEAVRSELNMVGDPECGSVVGRCSIWELENIVS